MPLVCPRTIVPLGGRLRRAFPPALLLALAACGDEPPAFPSDAQVDAAPDAAMEGPPDEPAPPVFTPCPAGFTEGEACGATVCEPFRGEAHHTCDGDQAHFVGEAGCRAIEETCATLFADPPVGEGPILYVARGGSGEGTESAPFANLDEALAAVTEDGTRILVGPGRFGGGLVADHVVSIRGACAASTRIVLPHGEETTQLRVRRDVTIEGVAFDGGMGLEIDEGASLTLRHAVVAYAIERSIEVHGTLSMEDSLVRDAISNHAEVGGYGILATEGAQVRVARSVFDHLFDAALQITGEGTRIELERVAVSRTDHSGHGYGLYLGAGAAAVVSESTFEANRRIAILAEDDGTTLELSDVVVRDTDSDDAIGLLGHGIQAQSGASLIANRVLAQHNRGAALNAAGASRAQVTDFVACDTQLPYSFGVWGAGVLTYFGTLLELSRAHIAGSRVMGVGVFGADTTLEAHDLSIVDTTIEDFAGAVGRGLSAESGAFIGVDRLRIERSQDLAVIAFQSRISLENATLLDTRVRPCATDTCEDLPGGFAVGSYDSAAIDLERFVVQAAPTCGFHIASGGTLHLRSGEVSDSGIGVCLQVEHPDLDALTDRVLYERNGANLDSTTLPVPSPLGGPS